MLAWGEAAAGGACMGEQSGCMRRMYVHGGTGRHRKAQECTGSRHLCVRVSCWLLVALELTVRIHVEIEASRFRSAAYMRCGAESLDRERVAVLRAENKLC